MKKINSARSRLINVLDGKEPDKLPVYTLIPFALNNGHFIPGAFHGYTDYDDWRIKDSRYVEIVKKMEKYGDNFFVFRPESMDAQNIFISPTNYVLESEKKKDNKIIKRYYVKTRLGKLYKTEVFMGNTGHSWITEHLCKNVDQALAIVDLEWKKADDEVDTYFLSKKELSENGMIWLTIPSPVMSVCHLFDPQDFLLFSALYRNKIDKLMQVAFERTKCILINLLDQGMGEIIRFGGAEHATPPMMSPDDFDEFVYQYDKPLMNICKKYNRKIAVHCHGNIKHALTRFMDMGVDQIDPVEATPYGDISLEEIREITKNQITLTGNIQFSELSNENSEYIKRRVDNILKIAGPKRLIISTTGTPLEAITKTQYENYLTLLNII